MVHQHFRAVPGADRGGERRAWAASRAGRGGYDHAAAEELVAELGRRHGLRIDPRARVGTLTVGDQQRVEILRALHRAADVLILDEPTAVLTPQETEGLFARRARARRRGPDACSSSPTSSARCSRCRDTVTVMRRGQVTGTRRASETDAGELTRLMVGRAVELQRRRGGRAAGRRRRSRSPACSAPGLHGIDLTVRAGEIVGVAGVDGNGQTELAETLAGLREPDDRARSRSPAPTSPPASVAERRAAGLAYIPDDRYARGLARAASVSDNLLMGRHRGGSLRAGC